LPLAFTLNLSLLRKGRAPPQRLQWSQGRGAI
jgi:hypothetical protein